MPRNVNPLDGWLRSGPGCIKGASDAEAHENAFAAYLADGGHMEYGEFVSALTSAGYRSACFRDRDKGGYAYRLQLPETPSDHDAGRL